jgi:hypothetical protein
MHQTINKVGIFFSDLPRRRIGIESSVYLITPPELIIDRTDEQIFDEIDGTDFTNLAASERLLSDFGLDFSLIVIRPKDSVTLICGPRGYLRLFFCYDQDELVIYDHLPSINRKMRFFDSINPEGVVSFIGSMLSTGPFEIRRTPVSIYNDWYSVPNGQIVTVNVQDGGRPHNVSHKSYDNIWSNFSFDALSLSSSIEAVRSALDRNLKILSKVGTVCSEVSGGIDSGIIFSRASCSLGQSFMGSVSCDYPFFEFSRERHFRSEILGFVKAPSLYAKWEDMLPFAGMNNIPKHDEPSANADCWNHSHATCRTASEVGAAVLLTGHGGDRLFLQSPFTKIHNSKTVYAYLQYISECSKWFPRSLYKACLAEAEDINTHLNTVTSNGISGYWNGAMFEPGWGARYGTKGTNIVRYVSGYASRDLLRCMAQLWSVAPALNPDIQKPVAHLAFSGDIPASLWNRPSKVNHVGISYRGIRAFANDLRSAFMVSSPALDVLGISKREFGKVLDAAANGSDCRNPLLIAILSLSLWYRSASEKEAVSIILEDHHNLNPEVGNESGLPGIVAGYHRSSHSSAS